MRKVCAKYWKPSIALLVVGALWLPMEPPISATVNDCSEDLHCWQCTGGTLQHVGRCAPRFSSANCLCEDMADGSGCISGLTCIYIQ